MAGEFAVLDPEAAHQRDQEAAGHGIDERGQRLTVFSSRPFNALNACVGIALSQAGTPKD